MGGILGLCTGFSIITAIEFFYWFSARMIIDHCTKNKKISPELPKGDDASEEVQKGDCQQCTKLECEVKELKSELGKQKEESKQQIEATKQQMEATKQEMEANTMQQIEVIKQQMEQKMEQKIEQKMEQKIAQLEYLLKSNAQSHYVRF